MCVFPQVRAVPNRVLYFVLHLVEVTIIQQIAWFLSLRNHFRFSFIFSFSPAHTQHGSLNPANERPSDPASLSSIFIWRQQVGPPSLWFSSTLNPWAMHHIDWTTQSHYDPASLSWIFIWSQQVGPQSLWFSSTLNNASHWPVHTIKFPKSPLTHKIGLVAGSELFLFNTFSVPHQASEGWGGYIYVTTTVSGPPCNERNC